MKAKVTWKGEEGTDQEELQWGGQKFKKGEAAEIKDPNMIKKAQGNQFFDVDVTEEDEEDEEDKTALAEGAVKTAPSEAQPPHFPAWKPGEPVQAATAAPQQRTTGSSPNLNKPGSPGNPSQGQVGTPGAQQSGHQIYQGQSRPPNEEQERLRRDQEKEQQRRKEQESKGGKK
jgi:hypothetical protein